MGSQTVGNTIRTFFVLRAYTPLTVILLGLWTFNPLGSQASFRVITLESELSIGTTNVSYFNSTLPFEIENSAFGGASSISSYAPMLRSLYGSALFNAESGAQYANLSSPVYDSLLARLGGREAAGELSTMDPWGNVRIPSLKYLPGYDPNRPEAWLNVPWKDGPVNYSSLIGVPFRGIRSSFAGNASFNIGASYHTFDVGFLVLSDSSC